MELSPYFWGFLSVHAACSLSPSYFHNFTSVHAACSLPPSETPPKLFPTVSNPTLHSRSQRGPPKLYSASMLHARFLPAQPPQAISNGFLSVRDASPLPMPQLAPSYLPRFPVLPHCTRGPSQRGPPSYFRSVRPLPPSEAYRSISKLYFHGFLSFRWMLASSQRSSPQSYFHGFLSVHAAACSLPPSKALPKLFPSTLRSRSVPAELSPRYFWDFLSVHAACSLSP